MHRTVVGEAADHQDLLAPGKVLAQRAGQVIEQFGAFALQLVGVVGEQQAAADADAPVGQSDAAGGQRCGQRLFQGLAALLLGLALGHFLLQLDLKMQLHSDHADQDQHERAQQHRHQVAEGGPDRRGGIVAALQRAAHARSAPVSAGPASCCRFSMIWRWLSTLRSTTSRAWAT